MTMNDSRSSSVLETINDNLKFFLPANRTQWKSEKQCWICSSKFQGLKKTYCKFCYRAVCGACSPQQVMHPETKKTERICDQCLQVAIEKHYNDEYSMELAKCLSDKEQLEWQIQQEIDRKTEAFKEGRSLEEQIDQMKVEAANRQKELRETTQELSDEQNRLKRQIQDIKRDLQTEEDKLKIHMDKLISLEEEASIETRKQKDTKDAVNKLKKELSDIQEQNSILLKQLETEGNASSNKQNELTQLNSQLMALMEEAEKLDEEIQKIQSTIGQIDQEILERNQGKISKKIVLKNEDRTKLLELKLQVQDQQYIIQKLRSKNEEETNGNIPNDISSDKCKCSIF